MNGDRPESRPQGTNSWEALSGRKDTKRKGVFNPFTCACMQTYLHTHTHAHTRIHIRTHASQCMHAFMYTTVHTHTHVRNARSHVRARARTHTHTHTYTHAHKHARTRTHAHMRTHAHIRAHTCLHTHVGAAHRARRPSHRLTLCLLIMCAPLALIVLGFSNWFFSYSTVLVLFLANKTTRSNSQHGSGSAGLQHRSGSANAC